MNTALRLIAVLILPLLGSVAFAQGTAFTYQGRLHDGTNAVSGIYDLRFTIYDQPGSGSAVAGPLTNAATPVDKGLFSATLDFGMGVFNGASRWLEIAVRPGGGGAFTPLTPRQLLTATPYALTASNLSGTLPATQLTGTIADARLSANVSKLGASIDSAEIADGSIVNADLSASAAIADTKLATISTPGKVADSALSSSVSLLGQTIESAEITDSTITSADIANGTIVNADISNSAAIADTKLATIATAGKVADSALSGSVSLLGQSIESLEIADGTIVNTDLSASAAIADTKLATISTAGKVADSALSSSVSLLGQTIESAEITDSTITSADIANGTIVNADISGSAAIADTKLATISTAGKVSDSALSANIAQLNGTNVFSATNRFSGVVLATNENNVIGGSFTGSVAASQLTGTIPDGALSVNVSKLGASIDSAEIADGTIVNADLSASAAIADTKLATISTAGKVADSALSSSVSLLGQTIESAEITDSTITSADIANGTIVNADISGSAAIADTKLATISAAGKVSDSALSANIAQLNGTNVFSATNRFSGVVLATNDNNVIGGSFTGSVAASQLTGTIPDGALSVNVSKLGASIDSAEIADGSIVNADISPTAAIADTKLATIATAGKVADTALSTNVSKLGASIDSAEITDGTITTNDLNASVLNGTFWRLGGNTGTLPGTHFLGTADNQPLEFRVNGKRGLRLEYVNNGSESINVIGGWHANSVGTAVGATIAGGGDSQDPQQATGDFSTVGGGKVNTASGAGSTIAGGFFHVASADASTVSGGSQNWAIGYASTVPGGFQNLAGGNYSFAAGRRAHANHEGAFVWGDSKDVLFASTSSNQFLIRASGGVAIGTNDPAGAALRVAGTVATSGDISLLDPTKSIRFPNAGENNAPMIYMFESGALNSNRMVLAHSPTYPTWGVQYEDEVDKLNFLSGGTPVMTVDLGSWRVGINKPNPAVALDVNGTVRATAFQGTGAPLLFATTDNQPLEFKVNNQRALRFEYANDGDFEGINVIGGHSRNFVNSDVVGATIAGGGSSGSTNRVMSDFATVGGGRANTASGFYSTVSGGSGNSASGEGATIGGGRGNSTFFDESTVAGGRNNGAYETASTVGGGRDNVANGIDSTVPGGSFNSASGSSSFAAGTHAKANHQGAFVWADSTFVDFASTAINQFNVRASGGARLFTSGTGLNLDSDSVVFSGSAQRARFGSAANVDINPLTSLDGLLIEQGNSESSGLFFDGDSITMWSPGDNNRLFRILDEDAMGSGAVAATRFAVDSAGGIFCAGDVGIRTDTPDRPLTIQGTGGNSEWLSFKNTSGATKWHLNHFNGGLNFTETDVADNRLFLKAGGNVGIGTSTPDFLLHVNGTAGKPGGGSWSVASDARLKKNIADLHGSLDRLLRLRSVSFEYKDPAKGVGPGPQIGFIAQEVREVLPQWVTEGPDGMLAVSVTGFESLTVDALRELRAEKDKQISELKAENVALRERLEKIEQLLSVKLAGGAK